MASRITSETVRVVSEQLGGSALAKAAQAGSLSATVFAARPTSSDGWKQRIADVRAATRTQWRSALEGAFGTPAPAARERLAGASVVITTGQQPGLFGGPMYTITKALAALALADALERETGERVAPVFWAATDDADFDEAAVTYVVDHGKLSELRMHQRPSAGTPMAAAPLGDVTAELRALREASGSASYHSALTAAERAYVPGATVGDAYLALLRTLLEPLGISVLDASHPSVRAASRAQLEAAVTHAASIEQSLDARAAELRAAGFEPQVESVAGASLVFAYEPSGKRRLRVNEAAPSDSAVALGPNVLLRPVVERALLPTVAYVAGPGELAYFAQVSAVATALGAASPLAVPRWSCTVVESHVGRALDRLGLRLEELDAGDSVEARVARSEMPTAISAALDSLRTSTGQSLGVLEAADAGGLVPPAVHAGLRRNIEHRLARLERRYLAAVKRSESRAMQDVALVRTSLRPMGKRQERVLNFLPLLARNGPALLADMQDGAAQWATALVRGVE